MLLFKLIGLVPLRVLYLIADLAYFIGYYIVGLRKNVMLENLRNAFPDKSEKEIRRLAKASYRNITDVIAEIFKVMGMSAKEMQKRVRLTNAELLSTPLANGQAVLVMTSHQCNWDWMLHSASINLPYRMIAVFKPLHSRFMNNVVLQIRARYGGESIAASKTVEELTTNKDLVGAIGFLADQKPPRHKAKYWTQFLNQNTGFYGGVAKIAHMTNYPVVFAGMKRLQRGYYEVIFSKLAEPPYNEDSNKIVEAYARILEKQILAHPEQWLWGHRRWKHRGPEASTQEK